MTETLNEIYAIAAIGTLILGLAAISTGIRPTEIEPIILVGALVVGIINIYWLFAGDRAY
ncbi:hypothetical protein [Halorubrum sp. Eb13]|uniref:hypothetical protein n=1 Tax=Halorubrum sp. Eb13 TaxID=1383843 RepID=UPI000B984F7B|nr:hypothetical protein [Halorubrum sp. Eb13]OYR42886.1 hypothetical protein DJ75_12370 [Halorubrum sp. Eb13]